MANNDQDVVSCVKRPYRTIARYPVQWPIVWNGFRRIIPQTPCFFESGRNRRVQCGEKLRGIVKQSLNQPTTFHRVNLSEGCSHCGPVPTLDSPILLSRSQPRILRCLARLSKGHGHGAAVPGSAFCKRQRLALLEAAGSIPCPASLRFAKKP